MEQLTMKHMEGLWRRMGQIFGSRWTSGPFNDQETQGLWFLALKDLSPREVEAALMRCLQSGQGWPPTLPEFRSLCLGERRRAPAPPPPAHPPRRDERAAAAFRRVWPRVVQGHLKGKDAIQEAFQAALAEEKEETSS